jgi:hypothetical protein
MPQNNKNLTRAAAAATLLAAGSYASYNAYVATNCPSSPGLQCTLVFNGAYKCVHTANNTQGYPKTGVKCHVVTPPSSHCTNC